MKKIEFAQKGLPKGAPMVANGMVHAFCGCKVFAERYDPKNDVYLVKTAEVHVGLDGRTTKKGEQFYIGRDCLFDRSSIPEEWPEELKQFVGSVEPVVEKFEAPSRHDIVKEALLLLETKLKRKSDKEKLEFLRKETDGILSKLKEGDGKNS